MFFNGLQIKLQFEIRTRGGGQNSYGRNSAHYHQIDVIPNIDDISYIPQLLLQGV